VLALAKAMLIVVLKKNCQCNVSIGGCHVYFFLKIFKIDHLAFVLAEAIFLKIYRTGMIFFKSRICAVG